MNNENNIDFLDSNVIPEQNITKYVPKEKPQKSPVKIIFSTIGFLLLISFLGICLYYLFVFNKYKDKPLKMFVNNIFNKVMVLPNIFEVQNINTHNTLSIIGNINIENNKNSNKYLINYEADLDFQKENIVFALSTYQNDKELNNIIYNYENNASYLLAKNIINKPIKLSENNTLLKSNVSYEEYNYLITKTKDYLLASLNEDDFDVVFNVENNKVFNKKVTFLLQNGTFDNLLDKTLDKIFSDEKYLDILYHILYKINNYENGFNIENVKEYLKNSKKELVKNYDGNIGINIYTDLLGKNIKKVEIYHEGENLFTYDNGNFTINFNYNSALYNITYTNKILKLNMNDIELLNITVSSFTSDKVSLVISDKDNKYYISIDLTKENKSIKYVYENNTYSLNVTKKNQNSFDYEINYIDYKLFGNININENGKYTLFDKTNYLDINALSPEEKEKLNNAFSFLPI